jgi:hypothetical protein
MASPGQPPLVSRLKEGRPRSARAPLGKIKARLIDQRAQFLLCYLCQRPYRWSPRSACFCRRDRFSCVASSYHGNSSNVKTNQVNRLTGYWGARSDRRYPQRLPYSPTSTRLPAGRTLGSRTRDLPHLPEGNSVRFLIPLKIDSQQKHPYTGFTHRAHSASGSAFFPCHWKSSQGKDWRAQ